MHCPNIDDSDNANDDNDVNNNNDVCVYVCVCVPWQVYLDKSSPMDTTAGSPVRIICEAGLSTPAASVSPQVKGGRGIRGEGREGGENRGWREGERRDGGC